MMSGLSMLLASILLLVEWLGMTAGQETSEKGLEDTSPVSLPTNDTTWPWLGLLSGVSFVLTMCIAAAIIMAVLWSCKRTKCTERKDFTQCEKISPLGTNCQSYA